MTGTIAGLATITPASGFVGPPGAIIARPCGWPICYVVWIREEPHEDRRQSRCARRPRCRRGDRHACWLRCWPRESFGGSGRPGKDATVISQLGVQFDGVIATAVWSIIATAGIVMCHQIGLRSQGAARRGRDRRARLCSARRNRLSELIAICGASGRLAFLAGSPPPQ